MNSITYLIRIFSVPEIRNKLIFTFGLISVYRLGFSIILPVVDQLFIVGREGGPFSNRPIDSVFDTLSMLSASNVSSLTIFGLGVMPYISASILFQLLATVYAPLEALQKEGDSGRRKINEYTRYFTAIICFIQSFFWIRLMTSPGNVMLLPGLDGFFSVLYCSSTMTAGCLLMMWIAEQIDEYGIGSGISLLIMGGILARLPSAFYQLIKPVFSVGLTIGGETGIDRYLTFVCILWIAICSVIVVSLSQRNIPILSGKHTSAARIHFKQFSQSLPLKLNQAGVMPVIFASSLMTFPVLFLKQLVIFLPMKDGFLYTFISYLDSTFSDSTGSIYLLLFVVLVYFFSFFWSAVTFNPVEIASALKDSGCFIHGYRPGIRTASYLDRIVSRLTFIGASFLSIISIIPTIISVFFGLDATIASFFGGTGLLICVSVSIEIMRKFDSYILFH